MGSKPKAPAPTPMDKYLRSRQLLDLNEIDIRENAQKKAIGRGRLGSRMLLSGSALGIADEGVAEASVAGTRAAPAPGALTRRQQRLQARMASGPDRGSGGGRTWPGGGGGTQVP